MSYSSKGIATQKPDGTLPSLWFDCIYLLSVVHTRGPWPLLVFNFSVRPNPSND